MGPQAGPPAESKCRQQVGVSNGCFRHAVCLWHYRVAIVQVVEKQKLLLNNHAVGKPRACDRCTRAALGQTLRHLLLPQCAHLGQRRRCCHHV